MTRPRFVPSALLPLLLVWIAAPAAASTEVRSYVEPPITEVGGRVFFVIEVRTGIGARVRFPSRLDLTGLQRIGEPSTSDSVYTGSHGSGRLSRVAWPLIAVEEGTSRIGPVTIEVAGETIAVPGASVQVSPLADGRSPLDPRRPRRRGSDDPFRPSPPGRPDRPAMFLQAEAGPLEPWIGQQVVYTLWAYTAGAFNQPNLETPARFPGFWAEDVNLGEPTALFERVWIDGRMYFRVPLLRRLLFPLAPGEHTIEPLVVSVESGRSLVDPLGFRSRSRRVALTSNAITVTARPLPDPPTDFSGAVGRLELGAGLVPDRVAVGEHATLEIELSGRGNLQGLSTREVAAPDGLTLLPPEEQTAKRVAGVELFGQHTWRYAVVPAAPGTYRLAVPAVAYFDPGTGRYERTASRELELAVDPAAAERAEAPAAPGNRQTAAPAGAIGPRLSLLASALAAAAAGVLLLVLWLRRRASERGPAGAWRRQLEQARDTDRPRRAAAAIEAAWRELLAARWKIAPELPPAHWAVSLRDAGAAPEAAAALGELTKELQALRRAPELSSIGALTDELIARSLRLARALG